MPVSRVPRVDPGLVQEGRRKARFTSLVQEGKMAEKNRKKTYLILIAILIVVLLITYL